MNKRNSGLIGRFRQHRLAVAAVLLLALAAMILSARRDREVNSLYAEAAGSPAQDSLLSKAAAKKLGAYGGAKATEALLAIALGNTPSDFVETRCEAIQSLHSRMNPQIAASLSALLKPHVPLLIRVEVSEALNTTSCNASCVGSTLHYLERVWWGDRDYEDRVVWPPEFRVFTRTEPEDHNRLRRNLYRVLKANQIEAVPLLRDVYGLGSIAPSTFAVVVAAEANLANACGLLLRSETALDKTPPEQLQGPRAELKKSVLALDCR